LAIDRYLASVGEEDSLKEEDVAELIMIALIAALDMTMLNWCFIHIAINPHVQEELYKEVSGNVAAKTTADSSRGGRVLT